MHHLLIAKSFIASFIFSFSLLKSFKCALRQKFKFRTKSQNFITKYYTIVFVPK